MQPRFRSVSAQKPCRAATGAALRERYCRNNVTRASAALLCRRFPFTGNGRLRLTANNRCSVAALPLLTNPSLCAIKKRTAKKWAVLFWYNKESRRRQKGRKGFLLRRGRDPCRCLLYGSAESEYFTNRLKFLQYFTRIGRGQDKNWTTFPYTESVNFHGRYV